jgi:hypothetical protein
MHQVLDEVEFLEGGRGLRLRKNLPVRLPGLDGRAD